MNTVMFINFKVFTLFPMPKWYRQFDINACSSVSMQKNSMPVSKCFVFSCNFYEFIHGRWQLLLICLAILIAASIDVQSLEQSLKPLENVYTRLTDLYMLWGTVAAALKLLISELNARSLHAKRTEKQHQEKLFNSLCMIEAVRNGMFILQCI